MDPTIFQDRKNPTLKKDKSGKRPPRANPITAVMISPKPRNKDLLDYRITCAKHIFR